jgi:hypothetical protein
MNQWLRKLSLEGTVPTIQWSIRLISIHKEKENSNSKVSTPIPSDPKNADMVIMFIKLALSCFPMCPVHLSCLMLIDYDPSTLYGM